MNKRRSKSFNRSTVYLGHPSATLPSTNMLRINQHTTTLSKALLTAGLLGGAALSTLGAGSALAVDRFDCKFGASTSIHPLCSSIDWVTGWTLEDKKLTKLDLSNVGPASGDFSFIYDDFGPIGLTPDDMWQALITFDPDIPDPLNGSYSYDLNITPAGVAAGGRFENVKLEDIQAGSTTVTKTILGGSPNPVILTSIDGGDMGPVPLSGTFIKVTDSWVITPGMGVIDSINNTYMQNVPAPLPLLGVGAAFGSIRKLRKFSTRLKTFSMN